MANVDGAPVVRVQFEECQRGQKKLPIKIKINDYNCYRLKWGKVYFQVAIHTYICDRRFIWYMHIAIYTHRERDAETHTHTLTQTSTHAMHFNRPIPIF